MRRLPKHPTLEQYYFEWLDRRLAEGARKGSIRSWRHHLEHYVLPEVGSLRLEDLRPRDVMSVRTKLLGRLSVRSAKTVFASFRALVRDARFPDELLDHDPFSNLPRWPSTPSSIPDPFDGGERDRICAWFRARAPQYEQFVTTLFHSGLRPSEAVGLQWQDVDLGRRTLTVNRSRVYGANNGPKTSKSARTIQLLPLVVAGLSTIHPLHADLGVYVFTRASGGPIDQDRFAKREWRRAMRSLQLRPRKFYATRHTFISVALSRGVNLTWLAQYCGTSVREIERSYGRFIGSPEEELARLGYGLKLTEECQSRGSLRR